MVTTDFLLLAVLLLLLFLLLPRGSAGRPKRGSRWVLFSETAADHQSAKPANLQPPCNSTTTSTTITNTVPLCTPTLSLGPLSIYLCLSLSLWLGVKMPAARSSGDKSDLPSHVIVKHPPGRLRPPHPFNSSTGIASEERRKVLHAAA